MENISLDPCAFDSRIQVRCIRVTCSRSTSPNTIFGPILREKCSIISISASLDHQSDISARPSLAISCHVSIYHATFPRIRNIAELLLWALPSLELWSRHAASPHLLQPVDLQFHLRYILRFRVLPYSVRCQRPSISAHRLIPMQPRA